MDGEASLSRKRNQNLLSRISINLSKNSPHLSLSKLSLLLNPNQPRRPRRKPNKSNHRKAKSFRKRIAVQPSSLQRWW